MNLKHLHWGWKMLRSVFVQSFAWRFEFEVLALPWARKISREREPTSRWVMRFCRGLVLPVLGVLPGRRCRMEFVSPFIFLKVMIGNKFINYSLFLKTSSFYFIITSFHEDISNTGNTVKSLQPMPYRMWEIICAAWDLAVHRLCAGTRLVHTCKIVDLGHENAKALALCHLFIKFISKG